MELTTAYTVLANNGELITPKLYTKILDHDGNVILDNTETAKTQVLKESTAWLMGNVLHNVLLDGTLHGLNVEITIFLQNQVQHRVTVINGLWDIPNPLLSEYG